MSWSSSIVFGRIAVVGLSFGHGRSHPYDSQRGFDDGPRFWQSTRSGFAYRAEAEAGRSPPKSASYHVDNVKTTLAELSAK
jgi:hypothetical protein